MKRKVKAKNATAGHKRLSRQAKNYGGGKKRIRADFIPSSNSVTFQLYIPNPYLHSFNGLSYIINL